MLYRFPEILTPKHRLAGLYPVRMSPLANSPAAAHYHAPREQVPGLPLSSRAANGTKVLPSPLPGRARWGGSGSLNPKSAPCGAERRPRGGVFGTGSLARGVDRSGSAH